MNSRWNWPLWVGLILCPIAFISYFFVFVRYPVTRDVPWVNLILFAIALVLLAFGVRRATRKVGAVIAVVIGLGIAGAFVYVNFVEARKLPGAGGAPHVGDKAPAFTLLNTQKQPVALAQLLSEPVAGHAAKGVLLVFYRGYW